MSLRTTLISVSILGWMGPSGSIPWDTRTQSEECGRVFRTDGSPRLSKIISGEDAHPDEFPWMVSIKGSNVGSLGGHVCGGFVIDSRHIISAAHCFTRKYNSHLDYSDDGTVLPASMTVALGQFDLTSDSRTQNATIEYLVLHPDFDLGGHLNHDIAILRTNKEINWESNLRPICLPEATESEYFDQPVTVAGWGNTNCHNSLTKPSKNLKKVSVPVWKNNDCLQAYKEAHYDFTREGYVCAGDSEKDSSKGDSGSPLMTLVGNQWIAIGIVSAGRFMCEDRVPGVYTKIASYISWINSEIIF